MIASYLTDRFGLEIVSRREAAVVPAGGEVVMCRVLGRYLMYVDVTDISLAPHLCFSGCWEPWITVALARHTHPGFHCIDVGANHGYFSLLLSDAAGPHGRVLAVEPNPDLAKLIERSAFINGFFDRLNVSPTAVTDTGSGTTKLAIPGTALGGATIATVPSEQDRVVEVPTATLDALTESWPRVDLVKIDAEGAEQRIWHGMTRIRSDNPSLTVVMEVNSSRFEAPEEFFQALVEDGFELRMVDLQGDAVVVTIDDLLGPLADTETMLFLSRPRP